MTEWDFHRRERSPILTRRVARTGSGPAPDVMARTRLHSRSRRTAPVRRVGAAAASASALIVLLSIATPSAAAPSPESQVVLRDVGGTRVARGGHTGTVTARVVNEGASPATGVVVRYVLPPGIAHDASASTAPCSATAGTVTCAVGPLGAGQSFALAIGVEEPSEQAVLGSRTGYFLAPSTDQFDRGAGEVEMRTWYHEAGAEGTDLALCWPIERPSPLMDIAGGICDGIVDAPELDPDLVEILDAFPGRFAENVVRSWEFTTDVTPPESGDYRACGVMIDDGGYLAIVPVGTPFDASAVRVTVRSYTSGTSDPFPLVRGERYRVLMRVSNRGYDGVDNGADGGTLAGWDAFGIAPADQPCDAGSAGVFGTRDTAWVERVAADVVVAAATDLSVSGAVESASIDGHRTASVRVANVGRDTAAATLDIVLPAGSSMRGEPTGCDRVRTALTTTCEFDALGGRRQPTAPRVVAFSFGGPAAGTRWAVHSPTAVDVNPGDNLGSLAGHR